MFVKFDYLFQLYLTHFIYVKIVGEPTSLILCDCSYDMG